MQACLVLSFFEGRMKRLFQCAAVLVAAVIFIETPVAWLGCGWIALAAALLEIGLWTRTVDFRGQAYMAAAMGAVAAVVFGGVPALGISLALVYLTAVRTKWLELDELFDLAVASSGIAVALAFTLLWRAVPVDYVAVCWFGLALATIELGNQKFPEQIWKQRRQSVIRPQEVRQILNGLARTGRIVPPHCCELLLGNFLRAAALQASAQSYTSIEVSQQILGDSALTAPPY